MSPTITRATSRRPLLTIQEEVALAKRVELRDIDARNELVRYNTGLVYSIVDSIEFTVSSMSREDLVSCGNIGLVMAANNFDHRRGFRFSTFATQCIRRQIMEHINNTDRSVRVPSHLAEKCRKIRAASSCHWINDAGEIARDTGYNPNDVRKLANVARKPLSLDVPVGDPSISIIDRLPAPQNAENDPERALLAKLKKGAVGTLLGFLGENARMTLMRRYGLFGFTPMSDKEQGELLGVADKVVKQRVGSSLKTIRRILQANPKLAEELEE